MTVYQAQNTEATVEAFNRLSVDDQLALLWYVYERMGSSITPAAPGAAEPDIAGGLFNQVKEKSHQEQLEIMRSLAQGSSTEISREYGSLSAHTKLAFWYFLAQGMDEGTIIPMPDNYQFAQQGQDLVNSISSLDFQQQITFLRTVVDQMGAAPASGSNI